MIRGRLHRRWPREHDEASPDDEYIEIDPADLSGIFTVPQWLRDVGLMSWLLVGVALMIVGAIWLAALTSVIVVPLIVAGGGGGRGLAARRLDAAPPHPAPDRGGAGAARR